MPTHNKNLDKITHIVSIIVSYFVIQKFVSTPFADNVILVSGKGVLIVICLVIYVVITMLLFIISDFILKLFRKRDE